VKEFLSCAFKAAPSFALTYIHRFIIIAIG
jgi:hypothetical protein